MMNLHLTSRRTLRRIRRFLLGLGTLVFIGIASLSLGWRTSVMAQTPIGDEEFFPSVGAASSLENPLTPIPSVFPIDPVAHVPFGLEVSEDPTEDGRGIVNQDNREPMTSDEFPWSAIGRVMGKAADGSNYICSGTLVADDVVLTNAHCVIDPVTHEHSALIQFQPNLVNGLVQDEAHVADTIEFFAGTDFREDNTPPTADDWAFLKLNQPLGEIYGTIGIAELSVSDLFNNYAGQLVMVGYSGDFPRANPGKTAGVHSGCSVLGEVDDSLIHDCDTQGGASGGPILAVIGNQIQIIGVNSAGRTESFTASDGTPTEAGIVNYATKISRVLEAIESI